MINKPTCYRDHHWLRNIPLSSSMYYWAPLPCFTGVQAEALVGVPSSRSDAAQKVLAKERNVPCHICSGRHRLHAAFCLPCPDVCVFSLEGWHFFCTKPRVRTKQQSCRSTAFRVLCSKTMLTQKNRNVANSKQKKPCVFFRNARAPELTHAACAASPRSDAASENTHPSREAQLEWDSGGGEEKLSQP